MAMMGLGALLVLVVVALGLRLASLIAARLPTGRGPKAGRPDPADVP